MNTTTEQRPRKTLHRFWRWLLGRDNCERCAGTRGVRGNENIVDGQIVCDYCDARMVQTPPPPTLR